MVVHYYVASYIMWGTLQRHYMDCCGHRARCCDYGDYGLASSFPNGNPQKCSENVTFIKEECENRDCDIIRVGTVMWNYESVFQ